MFNPEWEHPLVMFSWQHFVALGVVLAIYLAVFFLRKLFMKHAILDAIFRYFLAFGLIGFESVLQLHNGARPLFGHFLGDTYPLCGYMIWICALALLADSARLMKLIYPLTITGGTLSLIVIDMTCTFPHFGAFQFWFVHGGFMLGALYFVFTKKINKYTLKDLGRSCLFLFCLSLYVLLISEVKLSYDGKFQDPLFIISPPGGMESIKNALGQIGYSTIYVILIVGILFAIYGITLLCTKHRKNEYESNLHIPETKFLKSIASIKPKFRYIFLTVLYGLGIYVTLFRKVTGAKAFVILDIILFYALFICLVISEITTLYRKEKKLN